MSEILKILFKEIMHKEESIEAIKSTSELCAVVWSEKKIVEIFSAINDDENIVYYTEDILTIANAAYQEVKAND